MITTIHTEEASRIAAAVSRIAADVRQHWQDWNDDPEVAAYSIAALISETPVDDCLDPDGLGDTEGQWRIIYDFARDCDVLDCIDHPLPPGWPSVLPSDGLPAEHRGRLVAIYEAWVALQARVTD